MYKRFDQQYRDICNEILENGVTVKGRNNLVYTQIFGQTIRVDLRMEFPALTLRKLPIKNLYREFVWDINGESDVNLLGKAKHFWNFLAHDDGYLPASYGSSWRRWPVNLEQTKEEIAHEVFRFLPFDQLEWIHSELKYNPTNRQLVLTTLNPAYKRTEMKCPPCHPSVIFSSDGEYLDLLVTSRSNDAATGIPLDIFRYSLLAVKIAQDCSLKPRFVQFSSANNHIYEKNREDILTIISREPKADVPWIDFNPSKNLFNLDPEQDIVLHNYRPHEAVKLTVAV
jgi:thymidylate synthase